jgi:exodeoxyribonuclease VII small subunit
MNNQPAPSTDQEPMTYEQALRALEGIVSSLERGDLSLEDALQRFEQGVALTRTCAGLLDQADARVRQVLEQADGQLTLEAL